MKYIFKALFFAAAILINIGCTTLLVADFEDDTIGSFPDTNLPSDPSGDSVFLYNALGPGRTAPIMDCVKVDEIDGSKVMLLNSNARPASGTFCDANAWFISKQTSSEGPYSVTFELTIHSFVSASLSFGFIHRVPLVELEFVSGPSSDLRSGSVKLNIESTSGKIEAAEGSYRPFDKIRGIITFTPEEETYAVYLSGTGASLSHDGSYAHTGDLSGSRRLTMAVGAAAYDRNDPRTRGPGTIIVDNVIIGENDQSED